MVSCDYGTVNPASFGLWGYANGVWYRIREYYYDSKRERILRTDEEHYAALEELTQKLPVEQVLVDPLRRQFYGVHPAARTISGRYLPKTMCSEASGG